MLRSLWLLLLPAVLLLPPAPAEAQWTPPGPAPGWRYRTHEGLSGRYLSQGGAPCYVRREEGGYLFVNDQGSWAHFVYNGPDQLVQDGPGQWDPSVVCTVSRDSGGRTVLTFSSPNAPPGYWTSAD
jgi:hypothetical protein